MPMNENQKRDNLPLGQLLLQAFSWFDQSLLATLAARGWPELSHSQSLIFAHLEKEGSRSSELARRIGVTRQAVHKTLNELRALELVVLTPDPTNRSAKLVKLSSKGERNVAAALDAFADIEAALAKRLGAEKVALLRQVLAQDWGQPLVAEMRKKE